MNLFLFNIEDNLVKNIIPKHLYNTMPIFNKYLKNIIVILQFAELVWKNLQKLKKP